MLSALPGDLLGGRYGSAPAKVVALHGWRRTHADFDAILDGLDAVAPDLPGFGATPPPPEPWGAAAYAEACAALCESEEGAIVLGHSMGGRVAVMLAAAHPDRVRALVLTGAPLLPPPGQKPTKPTIGYRLARALNQKKLISDARMEQRRRNSGSDDYRNATGVMRDILVKVIGETNDGTYRAALEKIECPVALVWGERDTAAPPAVAEAIARTLKESPEPEILAATGHLTPTEAPAALREAIERWL